MLLASICKVKGIIKAGIYKIGAVDNASLRVSKAPYYCPAQTKGSLLRSSVSGTMIVEYPLINLL